jgi:hypothetical protein
VSPVDHSVCPPIPEVFQTHDDGGHVPSSSGSEESGRVLEEKPAGTCGVGEFEVGPDEAGELVVEPAESVVEALTMRSGDGQSGAGEGSGKDIDVSSEIGWVDIADVLSERHLRPVRLKQTLALGEDLALMADGESGVSEAQVNAADSSELAGDDKGFLERGWIKWRHGVSSFFCIQLHGADSFSRAR